MATSDTPIEEGLAHHRAGDLANAIAAYRRAITANPGMSAGHRLLGLALLQGRQPAAALTALDHAVVLAPHDGLALSNLATGLEAIGQPGAARLTYRAALAADPSLAATKRALAALEARAAQARHATSGRAAIAALAEQRGSAPAAALRRRLLPLLDEFPGDPALPNLVGVLFADDGRTGESAAAFAIAAELAPADPELAFNHAKALYSLGRPEAALGAIDAALAHQPRSLTLLSTRVSLLRDLARFDAALAAAEQAVAIAGPQPALLIEIGNLRKITGDLPGAASAFRGALVAPDAVAEAYWSLANLKTARLDAADIAVMTERLADPDLPTPARVRLHFALGKGHEDAGDIDLAFAHFEQGNRLKREAPPPFGSRYDASAHTRWTEALIASLQRPIGSPPVDGDGGPAPIFIVSLPRSGSTLVDQILASHPAVTATDELGYARQLAEQVLERHGGSLAAPLALPDIPPASWREAGAAYVAKVVERFGVGTAWFTDKLPNNFELVGFLIAMCPNARIVNCVRDPVDTCLANFRQLFASGQDFTYDLADLGAYYRDYARLMQHWSALYPGRIHNVVYEQLVAAQEATTRDLLAFIGLPFDPACLDFHANARPVPTASAAQVRQPIYRTAVGHARRYARHLKPLRDALDGVPALGPR